jgi:hypothetical protein
MAACYGGPPPPQRANAPPDAGAVLEPNKPGTGPSLPPPQRGKSSSCGGGAGASPTAVTPNCDATSRVAG